VPSSGGSRGQRLDSLPPLPTAWQVIREESKRGLGQMALCFRNERARCAKFAITGVWQLRFFARPVIKFYTVGIVDTCNPAEVGRSDTLFEKICAGALVALDIPFSIVLDTAPRCRLFGI